MDGVSAIFLGLLILLMFPIVHTDLREGRIPDWSNAGIAVTGLAYQWMKSPHLVTLAYTLLVGVVSFAVLCVIDLLVRLVSARAEIGFGDIKFLAAASLWIGIDGSFIVLFLASILLLISEFVLAPRRGICWVTPRVFGPMLALSMLIIVTTLFLAQGRKDALHISY